MKKKELSTIFNIFIIIFELLGLYLTVKSIGKIEFKYYTIDSNLLCLISSVLVIFYLKLNKEIPKWLSILIESTERMQ